MQPGTLDPGLEFTVPDGVKSPGSARDRDTILACGGFADFKSIPIRQRNGASVPAEGVLLVDDPDPSTHIPAELKSAAPFLPAISGFATIKLVVIEVDIPEERLAKFETHWNDGRRRFVVPAQIINDYLDTTQKSLGINN
jgi:hypothetical protein